MRIRTPRFRWEFLCGLSLLIVSSSVRANIYRYEREKNKKEYIRIIEHPEMKGYFSYGLCRTKPNLSNPQKYDHIHENCVTVPGQYWWQLHDLQKVSLISGKRRMKFLAEVLREDDDGKAIISFFTGLTWILGGWNGIGVAGKIAGGGFLKGLIATMVDWGTNAVFWTGASNLSVKMDSDTYDKTFPYTQYDIWSGQRDQLLDSTEISKISCDQCIQNCLLDKKDIHRKFFELKEAGIIVVQNDQKGSMYRIREKPTCELYCKSKGHPEFAVPTIRELWTLMASLLVRSDNHAYRRILFEYDYSIFPWQKNGKKLEIAYATTENIQKFISNQDSRYHGECLIGSECDQKYPMHKMPYTTNQPFHKTPAKQIKEQYSQYVVKSLVQEPGVLKVYDILGNTIYTDWHFMDTPERFRMENKVRKVLKTMNAENNVYFISFQNQKTASKRNFFKFIFWE